MEVQGKTLPVANRQPLPDAAETGNQLSKPCAEQVADTGIWQAMQEEMCEQPCHMLSTTHFKSLGSEPRASKSPQSRNSPEIAIRILYNLRTIP